MAEKSVRRQTCASWDEVVWCCILRIVPHPKGCGPLRPTALAWSAICGTARRLYARGVGLLWAKQSVFDTPQSFGDLHQPCQKRVAVFQPGRYASMRVQYMEAASEA